MPAAAAGFRVHHVRGRDGSRVYTGSVEVPHYGLHHVEIVFKNRSPETARVYVHEPASSPHRYPADNSLCMWHPLHSRAERWVRSDGLLRLLGHIGAHLFREHWWHETGEWLGPEIGHAMTPKKDTEADAA